MINFYGCGCSVIGLNVSPVSRCEEHGRPYVSSIRNKVSKPRAFKSDELRIRHHSLDATFAAIREKQIKFDLICGYPDHDPIYSYNALEPHGWPIVQNPLFAQMFNSLTDEGHVLLVIEQTVLARVLYDATMCGFKTNSISIVTCLKPMMPIHTNWLEMYVYKFAVLLSKGTEHKMPRYMRMPKIHIKLRKKFQPRKVLDISCLHKPFLRIAPKTIGVCEDESRYLELKRKLCQP